MRVSTWVLSVHLFWLSSISGGDELVHESLNNVSKQLSRRLEFTYPEGDKGICPVCLGHRHVRYCERFPVGVTYRECWDSSGTLKMECGYNEEGELENRRSGRCLGPSYPGPRLFCSVHATCEFSVEGIGLEEENYLTVKDGICNESTSNILQIAQPYEYDWGSDGWPKLTLKFRMNEVGNGVGNTHLCWAPNASSPTDIPAGVITTGPVPESRTCALGAICTVGLEQGIQRHPATRISGTDVSVVLKDSSCESNTYANLGNRWRKARVSLEPSTGADRNIEYGTATFGTPSQGDMVGNLYKLCWQSNYRSGRTRHSLKSFGIIGPNLQDARPQCRLGFPCEITLSGYLLASIQENISLCGIYSAEMLNYSSGKPEDFFGTYTVNFMYEVQTDAQKEEALCWQAPDGEEIPVGTVTLINECPRQGDNWPVKDGAVNLPAGKTLSNLYFSQECTKGSTCQNCKKASEEGEIFKQTAYFVLTDDEMVVRSCSYAMVCSASECLVKLTGIPTVETGARLSATAFVNERFHCRQNADLTVLTFGCQNFSIMTFMIGVGLVLLATVVVGLCLEQVAKKSAWTCLEGSVELHCTTKDYPSFTALRSCVAQAVAPDYMQWFDAWSSGSTVFARFRLPSESKPIRHWVTEVPGLCRVSATSMQKVQSPGRLPGAGLLELAEACVSCYSKDSQAASEQQHLEYATELLKSLRTPWMQALLLLQYMLLVTLAVALPIIAGHMMEDCTSGYPFLLHIVWAVFILLQGIFQWFAMSLVGLDRPEGEEFAAQFKKKFRLRLLAGWCVGSVSQTDMYMDLTFPVIARSCNFELWYVAAWLCALGIGIGQVGQSLSVIILGKLRAHRATSPERRERVELSLLFFLLRVTDNVTLCFAVRPALDQRLGGSSSWAARVAEARVPTARFLFEDVEQSALQVIFLIFFEAATTSDLIWIALSISTSLFLSLLLMVQVLPEVRDWIWYRLLGVVRRRYRVPLLFGVFVVYRFIASAPWLFACSRNVEDITILGLDLRGRVLIEILGGIFITTVSLAICCLLVYMMWKLQVQPPPNFQPPTYDAEARFSPKAFGAWSTEQDEWLEPLRTCMAKECNANHRCAMERLDNELFKLRHGLSNKVQATEALSAENIPDTLAICGRCVLGTAQLREQVQELLKDKRFTHASLRTKSSMIESLAADALSDTKALKTGSKEFFRVLPYHALKHGIPRSSDGQTVSVTQADLQLPANKKRMIVIAVSHCWLNVDNFPPHPDNTELDKARSLVNFAEWYIQHWGQDIEVFYWIDYSCIDQDNRDISVALLPALIASCTAILLWRTQDYETRSWTAMERVLAYSYCEGGLTPYVIDAQFTNDGQTPRWEPRKLPDPFSNDSTSMVMNASDRHFIQQLLECVFAVPAFEVFPDRQSISFGETEVVHLDLTCREPLRLADTAADGFIDGIDSRVWLTTADRPPALNIGMRVRTKDQVALLMPADVADTFVPILPLGATAEQKTVTQADLPAVVAKFDSLLQSSGRPAESDVALLLEVLQTELEAAILEKDEPRLMRAVEFCQKFKAFPPAALEGRRQLCRPHLIAAMTGSDRVLAHALQLAQQYGVDTDDFLEFRAAVNKQNQQRATGLKAELEGQLREADRTKDDILAFAVWQAATKATSATDISDAASNAFRELATDALRSIADAIAEKLQVEGVQENPDQLQNILNLAAYYGVTEQSEAIEEAREKLSAERLDIERMQSAITKRGVKGDASDVNSLCKGILQKGVAPWIIRPLLQKIVDWGLEQSSSELQEALRVVTVLGFSQEDATFKAGVDKLKAMLKDGLPEDWDVLRHEWSQAHLAVQQLKVEDTELVDSVQALMDYTMAGHKVTTADRCGKPPSRLRVKTVMRLRHPGNYLQYKTCRSKMLETIGSKQDVQELGTVKTDVAGELPGLITDMELSSALNEVILFHGTSFESADAIAQEGFRIDKAGAWVGSMFGRGAYFAERCLKADEYAGCGHGRRDPGCCNTDRPILVCRVLLGKFYYTDDLEPDARALENSCLEGDYDSVLADREAAHIKRGRNPTFREFVVFDKAQVYPEYVVWYTRSYSDKPPKIIHSALTRSSPSHPSLPGTSESHLGASPAGASDSTYLPTESGKTQLPRTSDSPAKTSSSSVFAFDSPDQVSGGLSVEDVDSKDLGATYI